MELELENPNKFIQRYLRVFYKGYECSNVEKVAAALGLRHILMHTTPVRVKLKSKEARKEVLEACNIFLGEVANHLGVSVESLENCLDSIDHIRFHRRDPHTLSWRFLWGAYQEAERSVSCVGSGAEPARLERSLRVSPAYAT